MADNKLDKEQENRKKGLIASVVVHALLLLLCFFFGFSYDKKKNIDTQFAVQVAFDQPVEKIEKSSNSNKASASSGKQRPKTQEVKKVETKPVKKPVVKPVTKPTPVKPENKVPEIKPTETPKPVDPIETEILADESPIVAVDDDLPSDEPEPEVIREVEPIDIPTSSTEVSSESLPSLEDIIDLLPDEPEGSDEGEDIPTENAEASEGDGGFGGPDGEDTDDAGSGTGDEGDGNGAGGDGDDNDTGIGTGGNGDGDYDDSGRGIFGRAVIFRNNKPILKHASSKTGKIVFKVCVNPSGNVVYRELMEFETTIKDSKVLRAAFDAVEGYKFARDASAPTEECGKLSIKIDNAFGIR